MQPTITVTPQNGAYCVQVVGKFGGVYSAPGKTAIEAATMVMRDAVKYDCGEEPLVLGFPPEVSIEIKRMLDGGKELASCILCRERQNKSL